MTMMMKHKHLLASLAAAAAVASVSASAQTTSSDTGRTTPARAEVTRTQAQDRAARVFDRLDANKDGQLDQADRSARQRARFDRVDADADGAISFEEFSALRERRSARAPRRGPMAHGPRANPDGARAISRDAFTSRALARFDRADADKDGVVTAEERRSMREMRRERAAG